MIKYRVNNKFVDENTFYEELRKAYDAKPQLFTFEECLIKIKSNGYVALKTKNRGYIADFFYVADEDVFEMEDIVYQVEYDALDNDGFDIAYALYKHGFQKVKM